MRTAISGDSGLSFFAGGSMGVATIVPNLVLIFCAFGLGFLFAVIATVVPLAVVRFDVVFVALVTVVVANDGIVVRIPAASTGSDLAILVVVSGVVLVTDHLMAGGALLGTV